MGEGRGKWFKHKAPCFLCAKPISSRGWAAAAHYRMHVRRGELVELRNDATWDYDWVRPEIVERRTRSGHYRVVSRVAPSPLTDGSEGEE